MGEDEVLTTPSHLEGMFERQDPQYQFDRMLGQLEAGMRDYDEIERQLAVIREASAEADAILSGVEVHRLPNEYPQDIAYAALRRYMLGRQAEPLESHRDMLRFRNIVDTASELVGRVALIETLEPDGPKISKCYRDEQGYLTGLGKYKTTAKGTIDTVRLTSETGGGLVLKARMGRYYHAAPLIDRDRDYQPNFRVTILK